MLIIMSGSPASGKTTLATSMASELKAKHVQIDKIRIQLLRDMGYHSVYHPRELRKLTETQINKIERAVWSAAKRRLAKLLQKKKAIVIVDATNVYTHDIIGWIRFAKKHRHGWNIVFTRENLKTCKERNAKRKRKVPSTVIKRMYLESRNTRKSMNAAYPKKTWNEKDVDLLITQLTST